jgi:hypothetical protein
MSPPPQNMTETSQGLDLMATLKFPILFVIMWAMLWVAAVGLYLCSTWINDRLQLTAIRSAWLRHLLRCERSSDIATWGCLLASMASFILFPNSLAGAVLLLASGIAMSPRILRLVVLSNEGRDAGRRRREAQ